MGECVHIEIDIECGAHSELLAWSERLRLAPEVLAARAIAAWLTEMDENPTSDDGL
jgi:hypothetical protein